MIKKILLYIIRAYQVVISPHIGNCCRFSPSCSDYCMIAIEKYGVVKGLWLGIKRLCRCRPYGELGIDPVP